MTTRKLASIRGIQAVTPIAGADHIEQLCIDGWTCVAKKGQFQAGQRCVYVEVDAFLPIKPEFEFLRKTSYRKRAGREGFRLKTLRCRGVLSQGLALPLSILPGGEAYSVGDDVTEVLGVIKYEPPEPAALQGPVKGDFPAFICKTDQERVQNIWESLQGNAESFKVTLKLEGASASYYYHNGVFGVCSRNLEIAESENNTLWKIARKYGIEMLLRAFGKNIALQGEIIGEGVQGNPEKLKGQDFYLFDMWPINARDYFLPKERHALHQRFFSPLKHVPVVESQRCLHRFPSIEAILAYAHDPSLNHSIREGLVFRSNISGLTFKVISNRYLLQEKA